MIEFLYWEGCPSHERALSDLNAAIDERGLDRDQLIVKEIVTHADAERERFIGSPTIRVNGVDVADPGDTAYGVECRIYYRPDGTISPFPDPVDVRRLLARYAAGEGS